jgi:hypothetical protein
MPCDANGELDGAKDGKVVGASVGERNIPFLVDNSFFTTAYDGDD